MNDLAPCIERAKQGDEDALVIALTMAWEKLEGWIRIQISKTRLDQITEDELFQRVVVGLLGKPLRFEDRGQNSFVHYVKRIVRCRLCDMVREACRGPRIVDGGMSDRFLEDCPPVTAFFHSALSNPRSPSSEVAQNEARTLLRAAFESLDPLDREILHHYYFEDFSFRELACRLGCSEPTCRNRCARAEARLRRKLGRASEFLTSR